MGFQSSLELTLYLVALIKILICALLEASMFNFHVARSRKLKSKSGEADGEVIAAEIHLLLSMDVNKHGNGKLTCLIAGVPRREFYK
jgi:hypothetical protein